MINHLALGSSSGFAFRQNVYQMIKTFILLYYNNNNKKNQRPQHDYCSTLHFMPFIINLAFSKNINADYKILKRFQTQDTVSVLSYWRTLAVSSAFWETRSWNRSESTAK